jgi:FkbM family methyltransferase
MRSKFDLFKQWNTIRLRENDTGSLRMLSRIPLIGLVLKTLIRLRNLGKLLELQAQLYTEIIRDLESVNKVSDIGGLEYQRNTSTAILMENQPERLVHELKNLKENLRCLLPASNAYFTTVHISEGISYDIALLDGAMRFREDDPIIAHIREGNSWISPAHSLLLDLMQPGVYRSKVGVIDVGAHIGTFSLAAASIGCYVIAIEGSKLNADLLSISAARNKFDHLTVIHAVAGDEIGVKAFHAAGPFGTVEPTDINVVRPHVAALTIDQLLHDMGWLGIDFVKIDVEGWEAHVLRGMNRQLSSSNGPIVLFESNSLILHQRGETPLDLIDLVRSFGYEVYQVEEHKLSPLSPKHIQIPIVTDYLAVKETMDIESLLAKVPPWKLSSPLTKRDIIIQIQQQVGTTEKHDIEHLLRVINSLDDETRLEPRVIEVVRKLSAAIAS